MARQLNVFDVDLGAILPEIAVQNQDNIAVALAGWFFLERRACDPQKFHPC
jgi:hypothetical protein